MSQFNPEDCSVTKAEIIRFDGNSRDITTNIVEVILSQSVSTASWVGSATVLDKVGILDKFGLRGEEEFKLELLCNDLGTVRRLDAQIYKIDSVVPSEDGTGYTYVIHYVSKTSYEAGIRRVIKPFTNVTASFAAENIFKDYFGDIGPWLGKNQDAATETLPFQTKKYALKRNERSLYIQPSLVKMKALIPNYQPQQAMFFLASRAYSTDALSSNFRFFETLNSYYFVTDEFLMKSGTDNPSKIKKLSYGAVAPKEATAPLQQISTILTMIDNVRVDTTADIVNGGYKSKSYEINLLERSVKEVLYDYTKGQGYVSSTGNKRKITDDIHTKEFMDATFTEENASRFIVYRDYRYDDQEAGVLRSDQHYSESIANRISHSAHMEAITVSASISGRLDLEPGDIVNVDVNAANIEVENNKDERLSGNYLITNTNHVINGSTLKTSMRMVKYV